MPNTNPLRVALTGDEKFIIRITTIATPVTYADGRLIKYRVALFGMVGTFGASFGFETRDAVQHFVDGVTAMFSSLSYTIEHCEES